MTINKAVRIQVWAASDGESTTFTLDLMNDPYWVGSSTTSGIAENCKILVIIIPTNWCVMAQKVRR
jgi:hypothetical protein